LLQLEFSCVVRLVPILLFVAWSLESTVAYAWPRSPKDVPPVTFERIRYSAPHWGAKFGNRQNGGYIEATDPKTGRQLWVLPVYVINYDPNWDQDVQDIFITSLEIVDGKLHVANERGDQFVVDVYRRKVIEGAKRVYSFDPASAPRVEAGPAQWVIAAATVLALLFGLMAAARRLRRRRN
jgi:hypothetical protein